MKTLKQIAGELNISLSRSGRIKKKIEETEYPGVPSYMIWGTGSRKKYNLDKFREYL